jgi:hypothetical protein
LHAVDIAAFIVSIVALLTAGWSAWGTHRQARATEAQAHAANAANRTAQEALALGRAADIREQTRQHLESQPNFEVNSKRRRGTPLLIDVAVKNNGPLTYDTVTVRPDLSDADTARLVRGVTIEGHLSAEVTFGPFQPGETVAAVIPRTDPELGGDAKLILAAARDGNEWTTVTTSRSHAHPGPTSPDRPQFQRFATVRLAPVHPWPPWPPRREHRNDAVDRGGVAGAGLGAGPA